jgi:S-adenosylmethionine synthetase
MARYIAKNIVAAGLAEQCEVALSYAIGKAEPTSVDINTFYTGTISEELIKKAVLKVFDLRPAKIIEKLELKQPIYAQTAVGGHFGKDFFMWELVDKTDDLKTAILKG